MDGIGRIVFDLGNQCVEAIEQKMRIKLVLQGGIPSGVVFFLQIGCLLSRGGRQPQLTAEDLAVVEPVSSCTFTGWDTAFSISAWSTLRAIGSVSTAPMALPATPYTTKIRLNTTASPSC